MSKIVSVNNLVKTFDNIEVISSLNMTVNDGCIYGFLGANGAGKTTVLKLLAGLLYHTNGTIEIMGMRLETQREEILRNIGLLIEVPVFYENLSATENLKLHLDYLDLPISNIKETLELVGLSYDNKQPVSKYSLGMRERLGIARAIIHKPKLLLLDEPVNGLDPMGIRDMRELFLALSREHKMTIIISSHILSEIEQIADVIGVITKGRIVEEVPLSEVKSKYENGLEDYFFSLMKGEQQYV